MKNIIKISHFWEILFLYNNRLLFSADVGMMLEDEVIRNGASIDNPLPDNWTSNS